MKRRIYKAVSYLPAWSSRRYIVIGVGIATIFFGFLAGAILNVYLIAIKSPLVTEFRSSLDYKSAIFGDGIILPIVNMFAIYFILVHQKFVKKGTIHLALFFGLLITLYFHISQAMTGLVNWTMPEPWHWNLLGLWHAVYMFLVCSLLSLFYIALAIYAKNHKRIPKEAIWVTVGVIMFLILLRLDYISVNLKSLLLQ